MHIVEISGILHIPGSKATNFNYQINYKIISKYLILEMLHIPGGKATNFNYQIMKLLVNT